MPLRTRPFAEDLPRAEDRDVLQLDAPDQRVLPVRVAEVLELIGLVRLRRIVLVAVLRRCGEDRRALVDVERDVALEADRGREVVAGGEVNRPAAARRGGFDRLVDRGRVERLAVARGAEVRGRRKRSACAGCVACGMELRNDEQQDE